MNCPTCSSPSTTVDRTYARPDHIRRRRLCQTCGHRWHTCEYTEEQIAEQIRLAERARRYAADVLGSPGAENPPRHYVAYDPL